MRIALLVCTLGFSTSLHAQQLRAPQNENPVYLSDSPIAADAFIRLPELIAQNNLDEASRLVHQTIINHGDRLIESQSPGIFIPVRQRMYRFVLDHPALLNAYRLKQTPAARVGLNDQDGWIRVSQDAWLTEPGMIASLHSAQVLIESGHFLSAIRILDRLVDHPDMKPHAQRAAQLANLAARFVDSARAWEHADQWSDLANINRSPHKQETVPDRIKNAPIPNSSLEWNTRNTERTSEPLSLTGIVPSPLGQAVLTPEAHLDELQSSSATQSSGANWIPTAWTAPVLLGDRVYTNDGMTVSCFDRFTLRPYWRIQTASTNTDLPITPAARSRMSRTFEDQTTITLDNGSLYLPTGIPRNGTRIGDPRVIKVDAHTGRTLWSIDIQAIDESLKDASIRGQLIVDNDTVIVGARTNNRKQRLISFAAIGLDTITGKTKWIRQIGSAGSLPFQQTGQLAHSPVLHEGIVYWTDYIGLAFAIDSSTGEVLWARSLASPDLYDRFTRPTFATNTPVITEHGMFTLTTDGRQILQLDLQTGNIIATRAAQPSGESLYLLRVNNKLACVSKTMVSFIPITRFENGTFTRTPTLDGANPIRGRAIVADNQIILPTNTGISIVNADKPSVIEKIDLDAYGNTIVTDGQILVVNENTINNFLAWSIASKILADRIKADPVAAITLAELAHRSEQTNDIVPYVNQAVGVINNAPFETQEELNKNLFDAILEIVGSSTSKKLSTQDQTTLYSQLATLAHTHKQVVAHRMAWGNWNSNHNNPAQAIRAYQDILDQPALGASMWEGTSIAVRGELEASRRIYEILNSLGYTPYRSFDQLAKTELEFLDRSDDPIALEQLAQRYPWSTTTPEIWFNASKLWKSKNKVQSAINAATNGIDSAIALTEFGINTDQRVIDQLAQIAIAGMIDTNHPQNAQSLAASIIKVFPDLMIVIDGNSITHDEIATRTRKANQLPKIGNAFIRDDQPLMVTGSPIKPVRRIDQGGIVLYAPQIGRLDYIRAGPNIFETIWTRNSNTNEAPMIPWQDHARTIIFWPQGTDTDDTGTLEAIETTTGRTIWTVSDLLIELDQHSARIPDDLARLDGQFSTPVQGPVRTNQLITITDGQTIVVTDRIGRAIGLNLVTGERLWNTDLPANRVHDIDLDGGVLGICGESVSDITIEQPEGATKSVVASIDSRTGKAIQVLDRFGQSPRWVRVNDDGNLHVATAQRLLSINTKAGGIDWVVNEDYLAESQTGWIANDHLVVLNADSELFMISLLGGAQTARPLDDRQRIQQRGWVQVQPVISMNDSPDSVMVTTSRGMLVFDDERNLIAADPMSVNTDMIDIAWGEQRAVYLQRPQSVEKSSVANLYLLDTDGAMLLDSSAVAIPVAADRIPISITAINGGVIVGYNEVSIFIRIPTLIQ